MKNMIFNNNAYIGVNCLLIGGFILIFTISTYVTCIIDYQMVSSNADAIKANYISESAIDLEIIYLYDCIDIIILEYLDDLKDYKTNYIKDLYGRDMALDYCPPNLDHYIKEDLLNRLSNLDKIVKKPFLGYINEHEYRINYKYEKVEDLLYIIVSGSYNEARKNIKVKIKMPKAVVNGFDSYGLEQIEVHPMEIISYFQEIHY